MNSRAATVVLVLVVLLMLAGGYAYFSAPDQSATALTVGTTQGAAELQFITLANELDPISFDTAIFNDPRFAGLADETTQVIPQAIGRADPFAPLGAASH